MHRVCADHQVCVHPLVQQSLSRAVLSHAVLAAATQLFPVEAAAFVHRGSAPLCQTPALCESVVVRSVSVQTVVKCVPLRQLCVAVYRLLREANYIRFGGYCNALALLVAALDVMVSCNSTNNATI